MTRRRGWSGITVTDQFCGAGGSTIGAKRAGLEVVEAQNHWKRAIQTYATNNPNTRVHHADVSNTDPRKLASTDLLITSPECTTHSPAGGNRKKVQPQRDAFMPDADDPAFERSRATMRDVPRYAEYHDYPVIVVENVVEATRWGPDDDGTLFRHWLREWDILGRRWRIVSFNSKFAHPCPQSRDRIYIVLWKKGNRAPDLEITPRAPCLHCEKNVSAVQTWKPGALARAIDGQPFGKYGPQYFYACPRCRHEVVPYYYAALNAIDLSVPGQRIGDRPIPLRPRTMGRIQYGLDTYGRRILIVQTNMTSRLATRVKTADAHALGTLPASNIRALVSPAAIAMLINTRNISGTSCRVRDARLDSIATQTTDADHAVALSPGFVFPAGSNPGPARELGTDTIPSLTCTDRLGVAITPPMLVGALRTNNRPHALDGHLQTITTNGGGGSFFVHGSALLSMRDSNAMHVGDLSGHLMTQGTSPQQALLGLPGTPFILNYKSDASTLDDTLRTQTTLENTALVDPAIDINDCYFRMLMDREIGLGMAFPSSYVVTGNSGERIKQYGNAVTPPVMDILVRRCAASLAPELEGDVA